MGIKKGVASISNNAFLSICEMISFFALHASFPADYFCVLNASTAVLITFMASFTSP
jgi:hypothetical protein